MLPLQRHQKNAKALPKGGFPLSRNFYVGTRVKFTCVNKIEAMYERPRVKVEGSRATVHTLPLFYLSVKCYVRVHN